MSFRKFYTVKTDSKEHKNVEHFSEEDSFLRVKHYPNQRCMTKKILHLNPTVVYIHMSKVEEIEERQVRF